MLAAMVASGAGINTAVLPVAAGNDRFCGRCIGAQNPPAVCTSIAATPAGAVVLLSVCSELNYTFLFTIWHV